MRVKMKVSVSGSRDGRSWPPAGGEIDVSDIEAADLCAADLAVPVTDDGVETAVPSAEDVEKRSDDTPSDIDALRAQAENLGVAVDKRWGEDRLRKEIDKAAKSEG